MTQLDLQQRLESSEAHGAKGWRVAMDVAEELEQVEAERDALQQQVKDLQYKADFKQNLTGQVVDLQKQVNALAAENLDLKHPGTYLPSKRETPATDAIKRQWMAEGAKEVAQYHFVRIDALKEVSRQGYLFHKAAYFDAKSVAAQLRQPEEKVHE